MRSALVLPLLLACGARSSLDGVAGQTIGPSSGGAAPCAKLLQVGSTLSPIAEGPASDGYPRLAAVTDDGHDVVVAWDRSDSAGTFVHHALFAPWKAWPSGSVLPGVHSTLTSIPGVPYIAAAGPDRYALAAGVEGGVAAIEDVNPSVNGLAVAPAPALTGTDAVFLASQRGERPTAKSYFAGTFSPPASLLGHVLAEAGGISELTLGCASTQPPSGDAVAYNGGWLSVYAAGAPFGQCGDVVPEKPTRIQVVLVNPNPGPAPTLSLVAEIATSADEITFVRAAPHPDGMFVAWVEADDTLALSLHAARIAVSPAAVVGPVQLVAQVDSGFAIAKMGRRLAIAQRDHEEGGVNVLVCDESLAPLGGVDALQRGAVLPTSALGSPDGDSIVIAWQELATFPNRVDLARFDCAP